MFRCLILVLGLLASAASASPSSFSDVFEGLRKSAFDHSPEIAAARASVEEKSAALHTSVAHWLPRIDLQLSSTKTKDYSFLTGGQLPQQFLSGFSPSEVTLYGWAVKASLPLFRRSVYLAVSQSRQESRVAEARLQQAMGEMNWRLRSALGNYLLQAYKVATVENSLEAARSNEREAKIRLEIGSRTRVDVLRSQANLIALEGRRLQYETQKLTDRKALLEYTGATDETLNQMGLGTIVSGEKEILGGLDVFADVSGPIKTLAPYLGDPQTGLLDEALKTRLWQRLTSEGPSYKVLVADQDLSLERVKSVSASEWPELSLNGSYFKNASTVSDAFSSGNQSYSVGAMLTIPLYLGGSLFSSGKQERDAALGAEIKFEKDTRHMRNEVEEEWLQIKALLRAEESSRLGVEQNEEILKLSRKSYEFGKATSLELLVSQNDLIEAKLNHVKARIDLSVMLHRFAAHLGVSL